MGLKSDKLCLEHETPLIGRVDKKFCNDMCRNSYNNLLNKEFHVRKPNVNGFNFYYYTISVKKQYYVK